MAGSIDAILDVVFTPTSRLDELIEILAGEDGVICPASSLPPENPDQLDPTWAAPPNCYGWDPRVRLTCCFAHSIG